MGNLFTKNNKTIPSFGTNPTKIQEQVDKIRNHLKPCCGKADIRFNTKKNWIECTNCLSLFEFD